VQKKNNPAGAPHYAPLRDGPPGHNLGDQLKPWTRAVREVLDISALGYGYEPSPSQPSIMAEASRAVRSRVRSPFWAD
jgi:tyrosinase